MPEPDKDAIIEALRNENEYLKKLLSAHGIPYRQRKALIPTSIPPEGKIALYRSYFRGNDLAYAYQYVRKDGKKGCAPACIQREGGRRCPYFGEHGCAGCTKRQLAPLTDEVIHAHLSGQRTTGIYPLLADDTCYFLAVDFDEGDYQAASLAYQSVCEEHGIDCLIERSQSGEGAHAWIFFETAIPAAKARLLGTHLLSAAMERCPSIGFSSFDRLFPSQDRLPKADGLGNLIILPLHGGKAQQGNTLFLDENYLPYAAKEQLAALSSTKKISAVYLDMVLSEFKQRYDLGPLPKNGIKGLSLARNDFPGTLILVKEGDIRIGKGGLSGKAVKFLQRLGSLANPVYYELQRKRMPLYGIPRVLCLYREDEDFISLPRGCEEDLLKVLRYLSVDYQIENHNEEGSLLGSTFRGILREPQEQAVKALLSKEHGILVAPPSFGKTVVGIALIARLNISTLILVPRLALVAQWKARLDSFLEYDPPKRKYQRAKYGEYHGSKKNLTHQLDIASLDSFSSEESLKELQGYGLVIIDECHHLGAVGYEKVARACKSARIYGLTATPKRSDGLHNVIYRTLGEILYEAESASHGPLVKLLRPRFTHFGLTSLEKTYAYADQVTALCKDEQRNQLIIADLTTAYQQGRSILLLSERIEHLSTLRELLQVDPNDIFLITGSSSPKEKREIIDAISRREKGFVLLSIGRFIGEGFDESKLDCLFIVTPFKWNGLLRQYVGRLHREKEGKQSVEVYDYIDIKVPMFARMYQQRLRGYKKEGYVLSEQGALKDRIIYGPAEYDGFLKQDLQAAKYGVLFCFYAYEQNRLQELIGASNTPITIYTNQDIDGLSETTKSVKTDSPLANLIIIDSMIVYCGGINPFDRNFYEDAIMRIEDKALATDLIAELKQTGEQR